MQIKIYNLLNLSDVLIAETAEQYLLWATALPCETITISVHNGWITLSGSVAWLSQKRAAVQALQHLPGLIGMSDHIDICHCENSALSS